MQITNTPFSQPLRPIRPVFRGPAKELGKSLNDVFQKTTITPEEKTALIDKFCNAIREIISPERFIGGGCNGSVYKIDDQFVAKIPKYEAVNQNTLGQNLELGNNVFKDLKTFFGEKILSLGNVSVLRNIGEHTPAGIPETLLKSMRLDLIKDYYVGTYLPRFASVPQSSYTKVAQDFAMLNKLSPAPRRYYSFDANNPNNIVLSGKRLILTDQINVIGKPETNSTGKLLELLLVQVGYGYNAPKPEEGLKDARTILKKIILAAEKVALPHNPQIKDDASWEFALRNCSVKKDYAEVLSMLNKFREKIPDKAQRLKEIERYIDELFSGQEEAFGVQKNRLFR